ncbi:hypothetical protein BSKO_05042 [Bryopsis sp. KO-2023]|nr:hypothetical protein BSKO_05042 [Bryopsis sp. KO-2023]
MSSHTLPVGFDSLVAGLRCAACHTTDIYASPSCRNPSRRRVVVDARKARIYNKGFIVAKSLQVPLSKRGPLPSRAVLSNYFGKDTPVTMPEMKDSVQYMITDIEKTLVTLRAALEKGSRKEAKALKDSIRDGFNTMTAMTRVVQKMVVENLEAETTSNGSLEELISVGKSMDSMRDQTIRIKKELNAMRAIVPVLPDNLSPEVKSLVEDVETLECAARDELSTTVPEVADSIQSMCQDLRESLVRGDDASTELKSILERMGDAESKEGGECQGSIALFQAGTLAAFVDKYTSVFGTETVFGGSRLVDPLEEKEVELKPLEELMGAKQNGSENTQGTGMSDADAKASEIRESDSGSSNFIVDLAYKNVVEAPPAPPETKPTRKPLGDFIPRKSASATFVIDKVVDEAFRENHHLAGSGGGGNIDDNSNNGGGGGGDSGGDEEPIEASAIFWTILLLLICYLMLLSVMLEAHVHVQQYWRQWRGRHGGEDQAGGGGEEGGESSGGDEGGNEADGGGFSDGGGVGGEPVLQIGGSAAAAMSMKSRALMKASASKEPKTGYVLTGALFLISVALTKVLGAGK